MDDFFKGKKALVTGAGKGFGRAVSMRLNELGAHVIAISRTQADLDSLKSECPLVQTIQLDLVQWEASREAVKAIGPIDMLVNNAGVPGLAASFIDTTVDEFQRVHGVNVTAAFNIAHVVVCGMIEHKTGGVIVNVSSICAKQPIANVAYNTSKAALDMLTMTMAKELGQFKIRTNSVNPGYCLTNMTKSYLSQPGVMEMEESKVPFGRLSEIKDIVDMIVYLLSDRACMVNGQRITVDGGAILP